VRKRGTKIQPFSKTFFEPDCSIVRQLWNIEALQVTVIAAPYAERGGRYTRPTQIALAGLGELMHFDVTIVRAWRGAVLLTFIFCLVVSADGALKRNGKIAFASDRDGNWEIYVMDSDGSNQKRLTRNFGDNIAPTWSPDGRKIAFISSPSKVERAIYVMNADGSQRTQITTISDGGRISWSPDGRRLAFEDDSDIFLVDLDGSNRINITNHSSFDSSPSWSPDGTKILFTSTRTGDPWLYTIDPDGSGLHALPQGNADGFGDFDASWSPNGDLIVINVNVWDFVFNIFTSNSNGTDRQLFQGCNWTDPTCRNDSVNPRWSPDGTKVVFEITTPVQASDGWSHTSDIYVKGLDGTGFTRLTSTGRNSMSSWQPRPKASFDFDGDGASDVSVFRPADGVWYRLGSAHGFSATRFGLSNDRPVPADYDGDGETDIAIFRNGEWWILRSSDSTVVSLNFGLPGDLPVPADYSGDGQDEIAVYRNGQWWNYDLATGQASVVHFGFSTDRPVPGDFDGDGRIDQAIYRNGEWHLNRSSDGYAVVAFGLPSDQPIVGDYDGDGKADLAVYRGGTWYLMKSTEGFAAFQWGVSTDIPVPADYDGDGRTDGAIFRGGTWWILGSSGSVRVQQFGLAGDKPIPATGAF
jgi:Tol biopolymer transport system component